jgi:enterochelin esterase-like enzyme
VFGPQSWLVLILLVAAFCGLAYLLACKSNIFLRVGAGALSFVVAAVFGMALVNKFYDYYQTWSDLYNDLTGNEPGVAALPPAGGKQLENKGNRDKTGLLVSTSLAGPKSGVTRTGLVYLPPEYFKPQFASARFPVVELFHGSPGQPSDWQTGLHTTETFKNLLAEKKAKPAVLVMPNINGNQGGATGSQCLDQPKGVQNDTYLSQDVPADVISQFRVEQVGAHWAVAGFSEGGFCAANLALRHPQVYSAAGVMSGYFQPLPEGGRDPFHGDAQARLANDPLWLASRTTSYANLPAFWLMAGSSDRGDVEEAQLFRSVLVAHGQTPPFVKIPRARHTFAAWNPALPKMLGWITDRVSIPGLVDNAQPPVTVTSPPVTPSHPSRRP